jgi:ubiquinone/menaquinone biosynthesis C-methylase UbiE
VLDCGSGGGDVSIIAGELVTSSGEVIGIDRDSGHVDAAGQRVKGLGLSHVRFETGDISSLPAGPFDAIAGRLVLIYQAEIETVLRALADRLSSGGVMAFLEYEHVPSSEVLMWPRSPIDRPVVSMDGPGIRGSRRPAANGNAPAIAIAVGWTRTPAAV